MSRVNKQIVSFLGLLIFGIAARLVPHAANFVPITALALLAAAYLPRRLALVVPLGIMVVSDLLIGMHPLVGYTWGSFVLIGYLGSIVYKRSGKRWNLAFMGPVGSIVFFAISNFGVWVQGHMYAHTLAGLMQCYAMAVPFFRATLLSDMLYTPFLFVMTYLMLEAIKSAIAASPRVAAA